jgi:hypothetical protein
LMPLVRYSDHPGDQFYRRSWSLWRSWETFAGSSVPFAFSMRIAAFTRPPSPQLKMLRCFRCS